MIVLRLPTDADLAESSLQMALDILLGAGESGVMHLIVAPRMKFEAHRLVKAIGDARPKSYIGMMSKASTVDVNYSWQDDVCGSRWMVIGQNHIVYTTGAGA